jgi:hypothetical protein
MPKSQKGYKVIGNEELVHALREVDEDIQKLVIEKIKELR